ncbi:MAG: hypothetical protein EAX81_05650 [Candidatus Thorarchaeota archaeon]|nr:hypothetical protein [Candidatus Thorarchaeota archaeon]
MYSLQNLDIIGYDGAAIPNTYFKLEETDEKAAIVFPGRGYTSQGPLLHYTISLLLKNRINVLSVDYQYFNNQEYEALDWEEKRKWLFYDVGEAFKALVDYTNRDIDIMVGKSLGTLAMGYLLDRFTAARRATAIWHTPLLKQAELTRQIHKHHPRSLFVIGTRDPHYDDEILETVKRVTRGKTQVIENANHSMEVPGDVEDSINIILRVVDGIRNFLWPVDK